jgi:hypothetical protein
VHQKLLCTLHSSLMQSTHSVPYYQLVIVEIIVWSAECFPALNFVKICLPKSKWCKKKKDKVKANWLI